MCSKSSLINSLFGRSVVTVSDTPGKTKHLQTLALTQNIDLCDCPGLVFPAVDLPRAMQALGGIFPIQQLREPFSAIRFLAERVKLESIYGLAPPIAQPTTQSNSNANQGKAGKKARRPRDDNDEDEGSSHDLLDQLQLQELNSNAASSYQWTPFDICEAYAKQRNYTVKGSKGVYDANKAANEILYDALAGVVLLTFWPPRSSSRTTAAGSSSVQTNTSAESAKKEEQKN